MSTSTASVLARAGGGGSSSGGGGGGGSSHSSSGSRSSGGSGGSFGVSDAAVLLVFFAIAIGVGVIQQRRARRKRAVVEGSVQAAAALDARWQPEVLRKRVEEVFMKFQTAWSAMDLAALNPLLTDAYRQRMVLQLAVLAAEHRKNLIERPVVDRVEIIQAIDATGTQGDRFTAEVTAHTHDVLLDTRTNTPLSTDDSTFTEYWTFAREGDNWEIDQIRQSTEEASLLESAIAEFATRNGFFYDPDFGWLMLPNEGVLFRQ
ncbi:MAG: TIM44-like domain-containing protein, partial [bacterium]|nr:TIM44-like domain-containing protein [bacterium]